MARARHTQADEVRESTLEHFRAIPWCSSHLSDPGFRIVSLSRTVIQPGHGHSLMAETWNTDQTIQELLSMYRAPDDSKGQAGEVRRFYTFGTGMNAHPNLLHGGVIAAILDSTMGNVIGQTVPQHHPAFTVALNVSYKKPVPTPGTVMARSWITKLDGRKIWVHGQVEDSTGGVHASAEGMWIKAKARI